MKNLKSINEIRGMFYTLLRKSLIMAIIIMSFTSVTAQTYYKMNSGSKITVNGTSNLHDWAMSASAFNSEGYLLFKSDQLLDVKTLSFSLPVTNLRSKEDLMDTRAYKALKGSDFPKIRFKLSSATVLSDQRIIRATGSLSIAGVTNQVTLQTTYSLIGDEIIIKGTELVKMNDYGMKAPSFMLGALKTGNNVTIDILLRLKKSDITSITKN